MPPVVAVVGRPNVGKSTLVNRIVGRREAIVEEQPGRHPGPQGARRRVAGPDVHRRRHRRLAGRRAARLDRQVSGPGRAGHRRRPTWSCWSSTPPSASPTRTPGWPTCCAGRAKPGAGRGQQGRRRQPRGRRLGLRPARAWATRSWSAPCTGGAPATCSTRSSARLPRRGRGAGRAAATAPKPTARSTAPSVAIVGRPNVGKSTLFNRLIGDERSVVHDLPGTTRDTIDTVVETPDGPIRFVDTAGMRRRAKEAEGAEYYSLVRALQAIDRADAALLVIDATEGVTHQDQRLAERVDARRQPDRDRASTSGSCSTPRQRAEVLGRRRGPAGLPRLRAGAQDQRPDRPGRPQAAARPCGDAIEAYHRRVPTRRAQPGDGRGPGGPRLARRAGPLRHPGGDRPADVHPVRHQDAARRPTCATSSGASGSTSSFGPTPLKLRVRRRAELTRLRGRRRPMCLVPSWS